MAKFNFMTVVVAVTEPVMLYLMYTHTGIVLGRVPSFVYDLRQMIKAQQENK